MQSPKNVMVRMKTATAKLMKICLTAANAETRPAKVFSHAGSMEVSGLKERQITALWTVRHAETGNANPERGLCYAHRTAAAIAGIRSVHPTPTALKTRMHVLRIAHPQLVETAYVKRVKILLFAALTARNTYAETVPVNRARISRAIHPV
jgi:hypothetical protein